MTNNELKPCPFCGGEAFVKYLILRSYIICEKCHAQIPCYNIYKEAKKAWNNRVDTSEQLTDKEVDEIEKEIFNEWGE